MQDRDYTQELRRHLKVYDDQARQLDGAYEQKDPVSWRKHPLSPLTPLFLSHLTINLIRLTNGDTPRPRIIDLGCGAGEKTDKLRSFSINLVGVDYLNGPLKTAQDITKKEVLDSTVNFVRADLAELPFMEDSFDGAHDYLAFLHIMREDWEHYIESVYRALKKGAPLLIVTFSGNDPDFYGYPINKLTNKGFVFSDQYYEGDKQQVAHLKDSYFYFSLPAEIQEAFKDRFEVLQTAEIPHPLCKVSEDHRKRKLLHVLLRKI